VDYDAFIADEPDFYEWPDIDENAPMGLCYTSGTTGNPKGVAYSHRSTYLHTVTVALPDIMSLGGADVMAPVVPMFHAMCWGIPFAALMLGSRFCNNGRCMAPSDTLQICCDWGATFSAAVPTVWQTVRQIMEQNPDRYEGNWQRVSNQRMREGS
jgi:fatty-acyl-CoA synthase